MSIGPKDRLVMVLDEATFEPWFEEVGICAPLGTTGYQKKVRVGAGGGVGIGLSCLGAFEMGAAYVVTGSVNQGCVGSGTSDYGDSPRTMSLEEMLKNTDAGFSETLLKLIDKTGKKDSEIYKKANLCKQHFPKIRNNPDYKPTKQTAIALALALELNLEQTRDLIGRAGNALTNSSKFDLIICYLIERGKYNVVEINVALYEFDQSLLGE